MMERQPLVSVIMPCYNGEKFIGEAIESVTNQTYQNWELIIINDGSTDNSEKIIYKYLSDSRIRNLHNTQNKGIPIARNMGIRASKGEYIAFLDQDDIWMEEKIEKQLDLFYKENEKLGLIFGEVLNINLEGKEIKGIKSQKFNNKKMEILENNNIEIMRTLYLRDFIPFVTVMVNKRIFTKIGLLDENLTGGADDYEFCLRLLGKFNIIYMNEILAKKRIHKKNFSRVDRVLPDEIKISEKIAEMFPYLAKYKKRRLGSCYYACGRFYQIKGELIKSREKFVKAISYNPWQWKYYIAYLLSYCERMENFLTSLFRSINKNKRSI
jgi:glycosyltransferase involved in cell wall biosynthesis